MNKHLYDTVAQHILSAERILLLTDERIDGDTTGSTLGLYHVLQTLGKQVEIFSPKPLPDYLKFVPGIEFIRRDSDIFKHTDTDLMIICDCSDGEYIKALLPTMPKPTTLISFDHHATNPNYASLNIVEPEAASTADVVWRFIKSTNWSVSPKAAQCLLTGICTDTVLFSTSNTTSSAIDASSELIKLGADLKIIVKNTLMNHSVASLKLWGLAMERLFIDTSLQATATAITQADIDDAHATEEDVTGISGFLNAMLDDQHEVVVVYRETKDGQVKGSLRSRGRDVAKLAADKFGGGGHVLAAGFKIPNARLVKADNHWLVKKTNSEQPV